MENAGFSGPWPIPFRFNLSINRNGHILMPGNFPIRFFCLVEKNSAHNSRVTPYYLIDCGAHGARFG